MPILHVTPPVEYSKARAVHSNITEHLGSNSRYCLIGVYHDEEKNTSDNASISNMTKRQLQISQNVYCKRIDILAYTNSRTIMHNPNRNKHRPRFDII